nr:unnamed protein product [Digitaria exilis]
MPPSRLTVQRLLATLLPGVASVGRERRATNEALVGWGCGIDLGEGIRRTAEGCGAPWRDAGIGVGEGCGVGGGGILRRGRDTTGHGDGGMRASAVRGMRASAVRGRKGGGC